MGRVAVRSHPPFSSSGRRLVASLVLVGALLLSAVVVAAPAPNQGYRLAGTVAVGKDYIGFLEVPSGGQVLVHTGSVLNGVKVLAVTANSMKIALSSGVVELTLEGTGKPPPVSSAVKKVADDPRGHVYVREAVPEQLWRAVDDPAAIAKAPSDTGIQRVAAVLELPPGSRLIRVQGQPVATADQAMKQLQEALEKPGGGIAVIDVQTPTGRGRAYITLPRN